MSSLTDSFAPTSHVAHPTTSVDAFYPVVAEEDSRKAHRQHTSHPSPAQSHPDAQQGYPDPQTSAKREKPPIDDPDQSHWPTTTCYPRSQDPATCDQR